MTDQTNDPLGDGIARAISAASAANDAAQDLDQLQAGHRAFIDAVMASQRRMQAAMLGMLVGTGIAVLLGGLVYFRSLADLREAAEVQATAGEIMVGRITELAEALDRVKTLSAALDAKEQAILAAIDGVGERIATDLEGFAAQAASVEPQFATAIQAHVDESLATTRDALLAAMGDVEVSLHKTLGSGGADGAELRALVDELKANRRAAPVRAAKPAASRSASRPAATAPRPAPKPADNPIRFP